MPSFFLALATRKKQRGTFDSSKPCVYFCTKLQLNKHINMKVGRSGDLLVPYDVELLEDVSTVVQNTNLVVDECASDPSILH
ncbi:hypothetical protein VNO80_10759 [Phaseolus coccineus]|uniref:Uncharacterized protein n=1 Tax=Phaseolus coccineus TaxID=3886 RepID=A0AAN9N8S5_PHACN